MLDKKKAKLEVSIKKFFKCKWKKKKQILQYLKMIKTEF